MGENPLHFSSSSTLNPSLHGNLPYFSSTLNPSSIHGSFAPSSSTLRATMGENPIPFSSTLNRSVYGSLLPSSSTRLYIDPVGLMPPSIPPLMRMMNFSASRKETLIFEELFQDCRQIDVAGVDDEDDEEEDNVTLELMPGGSAPKRAKIDLTLTIKPPASESLDTSRPHA